MNGRRGFDNAQDASPAADHMYLEEPKQIRAYMTRHTGVLELQRLNLLGRCVYSDKRTTILSTGERCS